MQSTTTTVTAGDGIPLHTHRWLPDGPPKAVVQIAHGLGEHSARYARLANALNAAGYAVYANDHRGHGRTGTEEDHGFFADKDGWNLVVGDLRTVTRFAEDENPGLPVFLLGHSMGSYLVRNYLIEDSRNLAGAVLSATGGDPGWVGKIGPVLALTEARLRGRRHVSTLLQNLINGPYNAAFKPNRTNFDWLSRDDAEVDKYIADELCGRTARSGFFVDLAAGVAQSNDRRRVARVRRDLPILIISGDKDPSGHNGKGPREVRDVLRSVGVTDVTCTLYPGARHEIFNETNRDEVTADLVAWLDAHLPS
jgi:alpha-beta hydrolase superfamily lysophospholipase